VLGEILYLRFEWMYFKKTLAKGAKLAKQKGEK
jgi:hypothetical protein